MNSTVDEAVASALHAVYENKTGDEDIDAWVEQSLITLGAMVKMVSLTNKLDITSVNKMLMKMTLNAYRSVIDDVAGEAMGKKDHA